MTRDVRLSGIDRGRVLPDTHASPRVRVRMPPHIRAGHTDNLHEARGILYSALIGGALWLSIGLIALFIAR
jgi:hypothetical protein